MDIMFMLFLFLLILDIPITNPFPQHSEVYNFVRNPIFGIFCTSFNLQSKLRFF